MELCAIKPDAGMLQTGDQVFYYKHTESGNVDFDNEHVTLFERLETDKYFAKIHISNILVVDENMIEMRFGRKYLKKEYSQFK